MNATEWTGVAENEFRAHTVSLVIVRLLHVLISDLTTTPSYSLTEQTAISVGNRNIVILRLDRKVHRGGRMHMGERTGRDFSISLAQFHDIAYLTKVILQLYRCD
jgi:hypothetical protein